MAIANEGSVRLSDESAGVGLFEFLGIVWSSRWLVLLIVVCCVAAGIGAAALVPSKYDARVLLSPETGSAGQSGLSSILGSAAAQLGGVSSLIGLNLSTGNTDRSEELATLQSEILTEQYIRDNNLLPILFSRQWDSSLNRWKTTDPRKIPTLWAGSQYFAKRVRSFQENARTGLVALTITWKDPKVAAEWANGLVTLTNDYMRDRAIAESERNIAYLSAQAAKTNVLELRDAIYQLMEAEIKKEMLARGSEDYALKVIDPAISPEGRSYPQPLLWAAAGLALGLVMGVVAAIARWSRRSAVPQTRIAMKPPRT